MLRWLVILLILTPLPAIAGDLPASAAVRFDRHHIDLVLADGAADRVTQRPATLDDPVRIASVSKLVTALGVMRLVDAGKLDLDRDVSDYLGWSLRNPAFPDQPITLRLLLSHQSSLTDGADYVIPLGETLRQRLADPRAWDSTHAPGSGWFAYTNLNLPVAASVMERVTGERFDQLMRRTVLHPLKLDACYNWSGCSPKAIRRAVVLYRVTGEVARDDLGGRAPPCLVIPAADTSCKLAAYIPGENGALFSPQGGLRISLRDLAKLGQMLARGGKGFLKGASFTEMTRVHWRFNGSNGIGEDGAANGFFCAYGLAVHHIGSGEAGCRDDLFGDGIVRMGHSGEAYGLRSGLWFDPASGRGLAFFTTAVPDAEPEGRSAFSQREEKLVARAVRGGE